MSTNTETPLTDQRHRDILNTGCDWHHSATLMETHAYSLETKLREAQAREVAISDTLRRWTKGGARDIPPSLSQLPFVLMGALADWIDGQALLPSAGNAVLEELGKLREENARLNQAVAALNVDRELSEERIFDLCSVPRNTVSASTAVSRLRDERDVAELELQAATTVKEEVQEELTRSILCNTELGNQMREVAKAKEELERELADKRNLEAMYLKYLKVVTVALSCDPISACKRADSQLEPPWEVFERVRRERDTALARCGVLEGALSVIHDTAFYPSHCAVDLIGNPNADAILVERLGKMAFDALSANPSSVPTAEATIGCDFYKGMEWMAAWLVDHAEGETVTEELARQWAVDAWRGHLERKPPTTEEARGK